MSTEPTTEETLPVEQNKTQRAAIAKASILNIEQNKAAYRELAEEATGIVLPEFKDPEFKKTHKKVSELSGKLVKARTAADKLVKSELAIVDEVKTMIKSAGEDLKAITADAEKEMKRLKEQGESWIEDDKQEQIRLAEEKKQLRMFQLTQIGMVTKEGYYQLGDMSITLMELIQSTEAQWEGKVAQVKVIYEAEQLRLAEEAQKWAERLAQEQRDREVAQAAELAEKEALRLANEAKQAELDAAKKLQDEKDAEIAELRALLKAKEVVEPKVGDTFQGKEILCESGDLYTPMFEVIDVRPSPLNGTPIKFTESERESIIEDVLAAEEYHKPISVKVINEFTTEQPYIDSEAGGSILRVYPEQFLDEVNASIPENMKAMASGNWGDLLYIIIKPNNK